MTRTATPKPKRRYSDDERASALAALAANGGNVSKTAREQGVPPMTLKHWADGDRHPEATKMGEGKKLPLADAIEAVVEKMVGSLVGKIEAAPLQPLATSTGIMIDKMLLLRGLKPQGEEGQGSKTGGGVPLEYAVEFGKYLAARRAQGVRGVGESDVPVVPADRGAVGSVGVQGR